MLLILKALLTDTKCYKYYIKELRIQKLFTTLAPRLTGDKEPQDRISDIGNPYYRCKLIVIGMVIEDTKKM